MTNLKGIKNGEATSIAIISLPSGRAFKSGIDKMLYISPEKGISSMNIINTANSILVSLPLNSNRCGINEFLIGFF